MLKGRAKRLTWGPLAGAEQPRRSRLKSRRNRFTSCGAYFVMEAIALTWRSVNPPVAMPAWHGYERLTQGLGGS